jgi:hypothetical protein
MANPDFSLLGLGRPEYIPHPGGILSAMAWSATAGLGDGLPVGRGIAYGSAGTAPARGIFLTKPDSANGALGRLASAIEGKVLFEDGMALLAAEAFCDELETAGSSKSKRTCVAPLNLPLALMQDTRGLTGKTNPANVAKIMDQLGCLGGASVALSMQYCLAMAGGSGLGVPAWLEAASTAMLPEGLKGAIPKPGDGDGYDPGMRRPAWLPAGGTPFHWLARSWEALCSEAWVSSMPRRRWTDWATCVARTGMASGFYYEMTLYSAVVPALATDQPAAEVVAGFHAAAARLLPWDDAKRVSERDVGGAITSLCVRGLACFALLNQLAKEDAFAAVPEPRQFDHDADGLAKWLEAARAAIKASSQDIKPRVLDVLEETNPGGINNLPEVIRYSFLNRGGPAGQDLYGLMKRAGTRYIYVDPGQEWLVVVAGLCSAGPGRVSRLRDLQSSLVQLGIQAPARTLVGQLEAFGLARSTHDADDAVEIQPAF